MQKYKSYPEPVWFCVLNKIFMCGVLFFLKLLIFARETVLPEKPNSKKSRGEK